ncbi:hypothetical protein SDC9_205492 [bioreactor metagenome]|uniref:Uncharacterized protein n=1 Tax=bioreactor metagenome TaxID=1076179 RepID=A0A645J295_9ZZZZ
MQRVHVSGVNDAEGARPVRLHARNGAEGAVLLLLHADGRALVPRVQNHQREIGGKAFVHRPVL